MTYMIIIFVSNNKQQTTRQLIIVFTIIKYLFKLKLMAVFFRANLVNVVLVVEVVASCKLFVTLLSVLRKFLHSVLYIASYWLHEYIFICMFICLYRQYKTTIKY
jgi:hypothetical protein